LLGFLLIADACGIATPSGAESGFAKNRRDIARFLPVRKAS
jgi:hypothetical protein